MATSQPPPKNVEPKQGTIAPFIRRLTPTRFVGRPLIRRPVLKLSSFLVGLGSLLVLALLLLAGQKFVIQPLLTSIVPSEPNLIILEPENGVLTDPMTSASDTSASNSKYVFTSVTNTISTAASPLTKAGNSKVLAAATLSIAVSGNHLVDSSGNTVHLNGVNRSGTEYACYQGWGIFDGPSDEASVAAMASWGINVVRIPLDEDCWLGINGYPTSTTVAGYRQAIQNFVTILNNHNIYAWISEQNAAPGTDQSNTILPMPDNDHSPAFWTSVATTFKSNPAVIFDMYNEPHDIDWNCWANGCLITGGFNWLHNYQAVGMKGLVAAVRATGAPNVINVPGNGWSYDISGWLANKPNDSQLIAGVHNYGGPNDNPTQWDIRYAPTSQQVPVVWDEMGEEDCSPKYINQVMPWADSRGIGYLAWTWDTWGTCEALISNYNGTPTTYGAGYQSHLATLTTSPSPPPPSPTPPPTLPTNTGSDVMTFNAPTAGTYTVWSRLQAADASSDSYWLQIDGTTGIKVGDGGVPFGSWTWVNHQNGDTSQRVLLSLTQGSHSLKIIGREANTKIDALILTQDLTFNPDNPNVIDSIPPVVTVTSPINGATLSGTSTVSAHATDDHSVSKVDLLLDNNIVSTQTTATNNLYSLSFDTTGFTQGSHSLIAKATDIAGNVGSSSVLTIAISNPSSTPPPPNPPPPPPIAGDLNGDGKVNILDVSVMLRSWNSIGGPADLNHDGIVNIIDLSILLRNWSP
jgi:endoglucanase